ncbi:cupredoxin domain-containing protein [Bartonella sp. LJL80]
MRFILVFLFCLFPVFAGAAPLDNYDVTIKDGVFDPPSIEVAAGQRFKISVKNIGTGPAEFENLSLRVEKVMGPGVQSFVVIHPLKTGTYHFIDEFHMDMAGFEIVVK